MEAIIGLFVDCRQLASPLDMSAYFPSAGTPPLLPLPLSSLHSLIHSSLFFTCYPFGGFSFFSTNCLHSFRGASPHVPYSPFRFDSRSHVFLLARLHLIELTCAV